MPDLDIDDRNPTFSHNIPGHDAMMHNHTKFHEEMLRHLRGSEDMILTLKTAFYNCHTILWRVVMHHYTKFGCKRFKKSRVMKES